MTDSKCGCEEELQALNYKIATSVAVQLTAVVLYLLGKLCICMYKRCCKDPEAAQRKARRKASRKEDKEIAADERWQAEVEKMELQISQNRKARKAIRAEKAQEAERKAIRAKFKVLTQKLQEQRKLSQQ